MTKLSEALWLRAGGRMGPIGGLAATLGLCLCLAGCGDDDGTAEVDGGSDAGAGEDGGDAGDEDSGSSTGEDAAATSSDAGDDASEGEDGGDGGEDDAGAEPKPSEVTIAAGPISGEIVDHDGTDVHFFKGVPYAAPATGELRWKAPEPVEPWTEVRDATEWGDRCPQAESRLTANGEISEDCLNLNVLTPSLDESAELPVMVFFHGGGLTIGTGNSPTYAYTALPAQGVVVVTVNQRLGPIGYLAHPALTEESENDASGNYGTMDQIAALEWVRDNARVFGGDPDNVTIFGESGGGTKVLSCMGSPRCHGLFHRAIVQSGSHTASEGATTEKEAAEAMGVALATQLGIAEDAPDLLEQLRALSFEDILAAADGMDPAFVTNINVDGYVFPQSVHQALLNGDQADVPLIVGANEGEAGLLMSSVPELATNMGTVSSDAWVYVFSHLPPGWQAEDCYAFHGLELAYVFGHLPGLETPTMRFLGMSAGCPTDLDPAPDEVDQQVADNAMKIWAQFAATGDPSVDGLIEWPAYTPEGDQYLNIDAELSVETGVASAGKEAPGIGGSAQE